MMGLVRRVLIGGLVAFVTACGLAGCKSSSEAPRAAASGARNLITRDEITKSRVSTAYDAVARMRPNFLRSHGPTSSRQPRSEMYAKVYVDGSSMGGLDQLKGISATMVESIEFLPAHDATTRFGTGHEGGAIMVSTRRR